jgi:hypothetical protein
MQPTSIIKTNQNKNQIHKIPRKPKQITDKQNNIHINNYPTKTSKNQSTISQIFQLETTTPKTTTTTKYTKIQQKQSMCKIGKAYTKLEIQNRKKIYR